LKATPKTRPQSRILVGTASWTDPGFVEHWYPKGMPAQQRLPWYAQQFEMVEVNSTFYAVPDARTAERWCAATPAEFLFDVKLHQLFSFHAAKVKMLPPPLQKKARSDENERVIVTEELRDLLLDHFLGIIEILKRDAKLGVLLLQLSPSFSPRKHQLSELEPLLGRLKNHSVAIEFRNRNWTAQPELELLLKFLRAHHATLVSVDAPRDEHFTIMPSDLDEVTNERVAYLRLHGRNAIAYKTGKTVAARFNYDYGDREIDEIAERATNLAAEADEVHVVFNNNALDYAPRAAIKLRKALGQMVRVPPETPNLL
jgi:uncharacterized protein YecE (DUF72 family)